MTALVTALVIALGQSLRRDDGAAAAFIARAHLPAWCQLHVLTQLLPELADDLAQVERVLFVDAALDCTVATLGPARLLEPHGCFSHACSPASLLDLCQLLHGKQPEADVLRLPACDLSYGEGLSDQILASFPAAEALLQTWLLAAAPSATTGPPLPSVRPPGPTGSPPAERAEGRFDSVPSAKPPGSAELPAPDG